MECNIRFKRHGVLLFGRLIEEEEHPDLLHVLPSLQVVFATYNKSSPGKWGVACTLFFLDMVAGVAVAGFKRKTDGLHFNWEDGDER
jgi:hypothetical protein